MRALPRASSTIGAPGRHTARQGLAITPYLFIAPAFIVYALFMLYPLARAVHLSLYDWDGLSLATFVGTGNYTDILADTRLRAAFGHAGAFIFFYAVLPCGIGLVLAAVLTRAKVRGLALFRTLVFLPQVIAMVVVSVAFKQIYAPDGLLNSVLRSIGLDGLTRAWLGDYVFSLPAVGLIGSWVSTGLVTVLLLAGMARIPAELFEAARLDGAGAVREFLYIIVPSVRAELTVALTLTIVASLKTFDLIYMTTSGGPGSSTTVPSYEVYRRAFETGQVGSAAAIGVTLTVIIFLVTLAVNRVSERGA
ncbi:carbohydrate ABC transporter permease [Paeniglutamicibacter psychrophenolicus]|uniref:carbohydrate ABC transporter permease n=1 Tax=Paeniglutamicibacter psychrophenolicus TaxID=257454 RepID=UPI00278502BC|nr:sugar ABC transporter permease [Paeniglutamicibacter psychrophenolicus]MDQ0096199.1 raffinose/stachyose/melibiose transport system permease protein [Paeniglutamicibacter psychrophenolicus]